LRAAKSLSFIPAASFLRMPPSRPRKLLHSRVSAILMMPQGQRPHPRGPDRRSIVWQSKGRLRLGGLGNPHNESGAVKGSASEGHELSTGEWTRRTDPVPAINLREEPHL